MNKESQFGRQGREGKGIEVGRRLAGPGRGCAGVDRAISSSPFMLEQTLPPTSGTLTFWAPALSARPWPNPHNILEPVLGRPSIPFRKRKMEKIIPKS
jgi:hypothetical protein